MCKGCLGDYDTQAIFMQRQRSDINVLAISRDIDLVVNHVDTAWMQPW